MDCGFTACMFTTEQIGAMLSRGTEINFMCGAAMDVGPGLKVWNCFPLFQLGKLNALDYCDIEELRAALVANTDSQLAATPGIFGECTDYDMRLRRFCAGGCKSFKSIKH